MTRTGEEARVRVLRVQDGLATVAVPGSDYQLQLTVQEGASLGLGSATVLVRGVALKVHPTAGGGQFIEPAIGTPRIICGLLRSVDTSHRRLLVDAVIPMVIDVDETTDLGALEMGRLVTTYVASGMTVEPAQAHPGLRLHQSR